MRNDRAGIGSISLPFAPINITQKEHRKGRNKKKKTKERGIARVKRKIQTKGNKPRKKRETMTERRKTKK
jgi:hypothetical protein